MFGYEIKLMNIEVIDLKPEMEKRSTARTEDNLEKVVISQDQF